LIIDSSSIYYIIGVTNSPKYF